MGSAHSIEEPSFWAVTVCWPSSPDVKGRSATSASIGKTYERSAGAISQTSCLQLGPNNSKIVLRPRHGYIPKVLSTPFRAQVITLSALPTSELDQELNLLCPVRALRIYIVGSATFRQLKQDFVQQRLSRWIIDAITLLYSSVGQQCPVAVRAHSTRGITSSWAWSSGVSIADTCVAAGWPRHSHLPGFIIWKSRPYRPGSFLHNGLTSMVVCHLLVRSWPSIEPSRPLFGA